MNKTILVAGGASVASLAAGAVGGYFFARKKLGKAFDERLDQELASAKRHYGLLLAQAKENKPSLEELAALRQTTVAAVEPETEDDPRTDEEIAEAEQRAVEGKKALVDYRGISSKASADNGDSPAMRARRIFDKASDRPLPPRDDTGKFVKQEEVIPDEVATSSTPPYIISHDDFLNNPYEYSQENLKFFYSEDTLLDPHDEVIDNALIGDENLKIFLEEGPEAGSLMCVRNEALSYDYEIQYVTEPLTEYMGLTED